MSRIAVAALILLVLSIVGYFLGNKKGEQSIAENTKPIQKNETDIAPGGNKAILTLANGSQIVLDTTVNGAVTKQGVVTIIKLDGQLDYTIALTGSLKQKHEFRRAELLQVVEVNPKNTCPCRLLIV